MFDIKKCANLRESEKKVKNKIPSPNKKGGELGSSLLSAANVIPNSEQQRLSSEITTFSKLSPINDASTSSVVSTNLAAWFRSRSLSNSSPGSKARVYSFELYVLPSDGLSVEKDSRFEVEDERRRLIESDNMIDERRATVSGFLSTWKFCPGAVSRFSY